MIKSCNAEVRIVSRLSGLGFFYSATRGVLDETFFFDCFLVLVFS